MPDSGGIAAGCRNRFHSYLCVDPQLDAQPGKRDHEEFIEVPTSLLDTAPATYLTAWVLACRVA